MKSTQEIKQLIGESIREARVRQKLTQKDLAEHLGIRQATLSAFENGRIRSFSTLLDILKEMKLTFQEIAENKGI